MSSNKKRVTYWLDEQGENDNDAPVGISREDSSVLIETELAGEYLHVFIGPSLFGRVREAMDRAEGAHKPRQRSRTLEDHED